MIEKSTLVRHPELEFRNEQSVGQSTCQVAGTVTEPVAAARMLLLKLGLDGDDPRWSSAVLDHCLKTIVETPTGSVEILFRALFGVLGDGPSDLTNPVASLIKDLVVVCFTRYRGIYDSVDWSRFVESLGGNTTQAQFYLALYAIPPQYVSPQIANAIVKGLESTVFHSEVASNLAV